ncbi:hypothetical protein [Hyphomicrobium sp. DMF-1]|jgi:hypothetical protein|uniref:hypothetical protein n=1 Tax=Hyphomicrobium sp. DMF-1 TaxID=3019544 RepID=UPI0022EBB3C4|nr:hypothetical protein [Hyphomicrobium sp. DMF-1]WBT36572.1 hypothetical protein PE058_13005 [Hyphomicrobium sp. DMF-1]
MKNADLKALDLRAALKPLEPVFRNISTNGRTIPLEHGREIKVFGDLKPRELAVNWLLAAVADHLFPDMHFTVATNPEGGDGQIYDLISRTGLPTEHVIVRGGDAPVDDLILNAIQKKVEKGGKAYAGGKTLVVFRYSGGDKQQWFPNKLARRLPNPLHFEAVWVVGFEGYSSDGMVYAVTRLERESSPVWWVTIAPDFLTWAITEQRPAFDPTHDPEVAS